MVPDGPPGTPPRLLQEAVDTYAALEENQRQASPIQSLK
jgi:hypothetical protein